MMVRERRSNQPTCSAGPCAWRRGLQTTPSPPANGVVFSCSRRGRTLARVLLAALGMIPALPPGSWAEQATSDEALALAQKVQNPIAAMISVPFQNSVNFGFGPRHGTQDILNIQPVVPFKIGDGWNVITRTVLPLIWQPSMQPARSVPFGTGPTQFSAFFSPNAAIGGWSLGFGPVVQLPTASDPTLGSNVWGGGLTGVAVRTQGRWVYGALVNNIWSFGGSAAGARRYNNFLLQPFVNYNFPGGWFVGTAPMVTANWLASADKAWTLPVGGQLGRLTTIGKQPINLSLGAYYNALRPQFGSTWQFRTQVVFLF